MKCAVRMRQGDVGAWDFWDDCRIRFDQLAHARKNIIKPLAINDNEYDTLTAERELYYVVNEFQGLFGKV